MLNRRSLFKYVIGGIGALLLPKKKQTDISKIIDESFVEAWRDNYTPLLNQQGKSCYRRKGWSGSTSCNDSYFYYIADNGHMFRIYGDSSFSFLDDPAEDIYTWTDGEPI